MNRSALLDMRDCQSQFFREMNAELELIYRQTQPLLLRPLLRWQKVHYMLGGPVRTRQWEYPWAFINADLQPGMRVLDAGCGGSPFLIYLAKRGFRCFGVDAGRESSVQELGVYRFIRRRLLEVAGANLGAGYCNLSKRTHVSITYKRDAIQELSFEDDFFDRVFCLSVMEHIPRSDWSTCIEELARVLRRGGRLIITLDMSSRGSYAYRTIIKYSTYTGLQSLGKVDHSVPSDLRHPDWTYETVGLVMIKEA